VINLIYSFSAGVSWQGHIGGGIAGLLSALVLTGERK
jgi:membrane associated rhomboid family serine protease